jgi:hypothetical protein
MAMPATHLANWVRDDLPDLLWPVYLIGHGGDRAAVNIGRFQSALATAITAQGIDVKSLRLDGRLTSLEEVPEALRGAVLPLLEQEISNRGLMPSPLLRVLRQYEDLPGRWLLVDAFEHRDATTDVSQELERLAQAIANVTRDGHLEALVKFMGIAWDAVTGQMSTSAETVRYLRGYPGDATLVAQADTVVRAMFGARNGADFLNDPQVEQDRVSWARSFWRKNWVLSPCLLPSPPTLAADPDSVEAPAVEPLLEAPEDAGIDPADASATDPESLKASVLTGLNRFLTAVTQPDFPVDLFRPAQHEVLCGMVTRTARSVLAVLDAPHMWCSEHGAGIIRQLAETEIVMTWMDRQDPEVYERYQNYGIGKAKLQRRRMSELAEKFEGNPPALLVQALERAQQRLGGDWGEEFINVSLDSTFAGISVRQMALDCGLEDLYRYVYQGASAVTHGEWDPIDDQMMTRCGNPLHRWHRLPSTDLAPAHGADLGSFLATKFAALCDMAVVHMLPPETG